MYPNQINVYDSAKFDIRLESTNLFKQGSKDFKLMNVEGGINELVITLSLIYQGMNDGYKWLTLSKSQSMNKQVCLNLTNRPNLWVSMKVK